MRLTRFATVTTSTPTWPAWVGAGHRRRIDPLTRMSCAAIDPLLAQGALHADTALVVSTAYGAVESTWRFATSIAEFGDAGASPTPFTSSVHSSCAGALGELLGLHGPCTTVSQGGHATTAALRWAELILGADRAPAVLVILADHYNAWSRPVIAELSASPWPLGDGAVAVLAESGDGPGRMLRWGHHAADLTLDAGAPDPRDEAVLATAVSRRRAVDVLGSWYPGCALAGMTNAEWQGPLTVHLRECEDGIVEGLWLEAWRS